MILRSSVYLTMGFAALSVWTEEDGHPNGPKVIRSLRVTHVEIPAHIAHLDDTEIALRALQWSVAEIMRVRAGTDRQLGS
jgi:hypothetical protein